MARRFGNRSGKNDEECRRYDKRDDEGDVAEVVVGQKTLEAPLEKRRESSVTHNAAQKRHGVDADLKRGKELPRVRLKLKRNSGAAVSFVS